MSWQDGNYLQTQKQSYQFSDPDQKIAQRLLKDYRPQSTVIQSV